MQHQKEKSKNRSSKRGEHKKMKTMKEKLNEKILILKYQIKRYRTMGNGIMCQALNGELNKLLAKQH